MKQLARSYIYWFRIDKAVDNMFSPENTVHLSRNNFQKLHFTYGQNLIQLEMYPYQLCETVQNSYFLV